VGFFIVIVNNIDIFKKTFFFKWLKRLQRINAYLIAKGSLMEFIFVYLVSFDV